MTHRLLLVGTIGFLIVLPGCVKAPTAPANKIEVPSDRPPIADPNARRTKP